MSSDDSRKGADVPFKQAGPGLPCNWRCMGCQQPRPMTGSRGLGVKKRCAICVTGAKQ